MKELLREDATALAGRVRQREVTPAELLEAALARAEEVNPKLNAIITPMYEQARATAARPLPDGPFTGVPFLIKDLGAAFGGVSMAMGTAFLKDYVPEADNELVARLKRTGLVIFGKTNTPEFGLLPTTEPLLFGPSRNPWDITRTTGGSSGGSAAAVAAGIVPMAHANDGGGSIRIPASCCGLFGLKPTRGRITKAPLGDVMSGLTNDHAVTRSVRDSAALLDLTAGPAPGDPYFAAPPARAFAAEVGADPGRLRIAFTTSSPSGVPVHPDCIAAVADAARLCADLGHDVVESSPDLNGDLLTQAFIGVWAAGCAWTIDGMARLTGWSPDQDRFEPYTWALYQLGRSLSAPDYLLAISALQETGRQMAAFLGGYDLLLTPTLAEPPLPLGSFDVTPDDPMQALWRAASWVPFTPLSNATGQPAMSVPLYWNEQGLPIGTQFIARFGDEATLFRLAAQLEAARPWAHRRPTISAL